MNYIVVNTNPHQSIRKSCTTDKRTVTTSKFENSVCFKSSPTMDRKDSIQSLISRIYTHTLKDNHLSGHEIKLKSKSPRTVPCSPFLHREGSSQRIKHVRHKEAVQAEISKSFCTRELPPNFPSELAGTYFHPPIKLSPSLTPPQLKTIQSRNSHSILAANLRMRDRGSEMSDLRIRNSRAKSAEYRATLQDIKTRTSIRQLISLP